MTAASQSPAHAKDNGFYSRLKSVVSITILIKICILLLQYFSLSTTIEGSRVLFGGSIKLFILSYFFQDIPASLVFALSIQGLLAIFLVANNKIEGTQKSTFFLVIIYLTVLSSYTSFFSIYDTISGGKYSEDPVLNTAKREFNLLVGNTFTPYKDELFRLENISERERCNKYNEKPIGDPPEGCDKDGTQETGEGDDYKIAEKSQKQAEERIDRIRPYVVKSGIQEIIDESSKTDSVADYKDKIYDVTSKIPPDIKEEIAKKFDLGRYERDDSGNSELDKILEQSSKEVGFLIPLEKIFKDQDPKAVVALVIAMSIDVIGFAIGIKNKGERFKALSEDLSRFLEEATNFVSGLITSIVRVVFKVFLAIVNEVIAIASEIFLELIINRYICFRDLFSTASDNSSGVSKLHFSEQTAKSFLEYLSQCSDFEEGVVNVTKLFQTESITYQRNYMALLCFCKKQNIFVDNPQNSDDKKDQSNGPYTKRTAGYGEKKLKVDDIDTYVNWLSQEFNRLNHPMSQFKSRNFSYINLPNKHTPS